MTGDWANFVQRCSSANWKEALVAAVTYAPNEEFSAICSSIGDRLNDSSASLGQMMCYICAGDLEKLVSCWMRTKDTSSGPMALQDLVEVVMTLKMAIERMFGEFDISSGALSEELSQYANVLAAQGAMSAALSYLGTSSEESIAQLRERLNGAIGRKARQQSVASTGGRISGKLRRHWNLSG